MARDSRQFEEALKAYKAQKTRFHRVPNYNITPRRIVTSEAMVVQHELKDVLAELKRLTKRKHELQRQLKASGQKMIRSEYFDKPIMLYALRLEDSCWYVGMSRDVDKRFRKHGGRKGSNWTREHKPIEIFEVRETGLTDDREVALMEDDMTIEYAVMYGTANVRGGGYCQRYPRWPSQVAVYRPC